MLFVVCHLRKLCNMLMIMVEEDRVCIYRLHRVGERHAPLCEKWPCVFIDLYESCSVCDAVNECACEACVYP